MENKISILVSTCTQYSSLWDPLIDDYKLLFPQYEGHFYFTSNSNIFLKNEAKMILLNKDYKYWGTRMIKTVKKIKSEYILLIMDDFFLEREVDDILLDNIINVIKNDKRIGFIKLYDKPNYLDSIKYKQYNNFLIEEDLKSPYRIACQAGVWKKSYLLKILRWSESPWDFEINGSVRSRFYKKLCLTYIGTKKPITYFGGLLVSLGVINEQIKQTIENKTNINLSKIRILQSHSVSTKDSKFKRFYRNKIYWRLALFLKFIKY